MFGCSSCFRRTTAPIAASLVGANFSKIGPGGEEGEDRLLRGQENVLMGRRKLRGIFWRVGYGGEWGVAGKSVRRECWPVNTAPDEPARED